MKTFSLLAILMLFFTACTVATTNQEATNIEESANPPTTNKEAVTQNSGSNILAGTTTTYQKFTKEEYEKAIMEDKVIILNFYANWCPSCKAEEPEAFEAFNSLENDNIIGFRVNYKDSDTDKDEEAIAREFGIAFQHTKVVLKGNEEIQKTLENWDSEKYVEELSKLV